MKLPSAPSSPSPRFEPLPHSARPKKVLLKRHLEEHDDTVQEEESNKKPKRGFRFT
jgi:hypothetical protein